MANPWTRLEAARLRIAALKSFTDHDHDDTVVKVRKDCDACRLAGYAPLVDDGLPQPDHANWARLYVQAKKPVPLVFREAFESQRVNPNNVLYAAALARDIATFGMPPEESN